MKATRCNLGDMAKVVRSTTGCVCTATAAEQGVVIYCGEPTMSYFGPGWLLKTPRPCAGCGNTMFGYLDADLDPIRPPPLADIAKTDESRPVEVQGA